MDVRHATTYGCTPQTAQILVRSDRRAWAGAPCTLQCSQLLQSESSLIIRSLCWRALTDLRVAQILWVGGLAVNIAACTLAAGLLFLPSLRLYGIAILTTQARYLTDVGVMQHLSVALARASLTNAGPLASRAC